MALSINPNGVLPFYKRLQHQAHRRYGHRCSCIIAPNAYSLLPFQIPFPNEIISYDFELYDCDDNFVQNLSFLFELDEICTTDGYLLSYDGSKSRLFLDCDKPHYIKLTINGVAHYSELFCCDCFNYNVNETSCFDLECYPLKCDIQIPPVNVTCELLQNGNIRVTINSSAASNYISSINNLNFPVVIHSTQGTIIPSFAGVAVYEASFFPRDFLVQMTAVNFDCNGEPITLRADAEFTLSGLIPPLGIPLNKTFAWGEPFNANETRLVLCPCDDVNSPICDENYYILDANNNRNLLGEGQKVILDVSEITDRPIIVERCISTAFNDELCSIYQIDVDESNVCDSTITNLSAPPTNFTVCVNNPCNNSPLEGAIVTVGTQSVTTAADGKAVFTNVVIGQNVSVSEPTTVNCGNGITTFDQVLIQQTILALNSFTQNWELIAADMNNSSTITTFDLTLMSQIILGNPTPAAVTKCWEFLPVSEYNSLPSVPATFTTNVPAFTTTATVTNVNGTVNFYGIKKGDVNCSASNQL